MDNRGFDRPGADRGSDPTDGGIGEATFAIGADERRMHVRAYNHWVSLLKGGAYPRISDLDPAGNMDFGAHGVLLDFTDGLDDPVITFLGDALREECGVDRAISRIGQVPARSLLSRLTDHYLKIIANRAPIGFEAEFVGTRGHNTLYRGILMPFTSNSETIDFVYGVINWKEIVGAEEQAMLAAELDAAVRSAPRHEVVGAVWADGPGASRGSEAEAPPARTPLATLALDLPSAADQMVVLLAKARGDGMFDVIGSVSEDQDLIRRVSTTIG